MHDHVRVPPTRRSRQAAPPVTTPLKFRQRRFRGRTLDERLAVRAPRLLSSIAARVTRLPVGSRLRRYLVARRTCQGFQAVGRGDLDLLLAVYHDHVVTTFESVDGWPPDLVGSHEGKDAFRRVWESWSELWEELRVEPRELVDFGDRLLVTVDMVGRGRSSGVQTEVRYYDLYVLRDGLISQHRMFRNRDAAFAAATERGRDGG